MAETIFDKVLTDQDIGDPVSVPHGGHGGSTVAEALANLSAIGTIAQTLTSAQKQQARTNIDAMGTLRGSLGSNDDLNNLTSASTNGLYYVTTGVANSPASWSALISIMVEDVGSQIVINGRTIYTRTRAGNPHEWSEWGVILTSVTGGLDCRFVSSGSMKSIKGSGIYYISNSVTDKPSSSGGMLILADGTGTGATMAGLYQPNSTNVGPYRVSVVNGTWSYST